MTNQIICLFDLIYPDHRRNRRSSHISGECQWHQQQSIYRPANIVDEMNRSPFEDRHPVFRAMFWCFKFIKKKKKESIKFRSNWYKSFQFFISLCLSMNLCHLEFITHARTHHQKKKQIINLESNANHKKPVLKKFNGITKKGAEKSIFWFGSPWWVNGIENQEIR